MLQKFDYQDKRVLIVDDDPTNVRVITNYLTKAGINVISASNGREGVSVAVERTPDLIILDILMPEMDGYEACHQLKKNELTEDIPIIFHSTLDDVGDKLKGFATGAIDYLIKPVDEAELLARVSTHMHLHDLQQRLAKRGDRLDAALDTSNVVNVAIGVLMERHRLGRQSAFDSLRHRARSQRRKVIAVAQELLDGLHQVNLWPDESKHGGKH